MGQWKQSGHSNFGSRRAVGGARPIAAGVCSWLGLRMEVEPSGTSLAPWAYRTFLGLEVACPATPFAPLYRYIINNSGVEACGVAFDKGDALDSSKSSFRKKETLPALPIEAGVARVLDVIFPKRDHPDANIGAHHWHHPHLCKRPGTRPPGRNVVPYPANKFSP